MPVPTPKQDETEKDYISRCIRFLKDERPVRPDKQIQAICFDTWRRNNETLHPDFLRMRALFIRRFGEVAGIQRYLKFVSENSLDQTKQYHPHAQFKESIQQESFSWASPLISYLRQDKNAKYYAVTCLTANISMNNNDYTDPQKMAAASISMNYMPVNLNHNHSAWFHYPQTRLDWAKFEDMSVEGILRVDNSDKRLQQMLDHDPAIPKKEWINHPSIEARPIPEHMGGGYHFTGIAMLQKGYALPGDPLSEIQPLFTESIHSSLKKEFLVTCKIVEGKIICKKEEKNVNEQARNDAERAMSHFNITPEDWAKLSDAEKQKYIDQLPPRGTANDKASEDNTSEEETDVPTPPSPEEVDSEEAAWKAEKAKLQKEHYTVKRGLEEQISTLTKQLRDSKHRESEANKKADTFENVKESLGETEVKVAEQKTEMKKLRGTIKEQKAIISRRDDRIEDLKTEIGDFEEQVSKLKTQLDNLKEQMRKKNIELATAHQETKEANKLRDEARDALSNVTDEHSDLAAKYSEAVDGKLETSKKLHDLTKKFDKLKEELRTTKAALDAQNEEAEGLRHDLKLAYKKDKRRKEENLKKGIVPVSMIKGVQ